MADVAKVLDAGMGIITNRIAGAGTEPKYVAWGTGTTAAANTDTGLQTAAAEARTTGTSSRTQTNVANDTYQVIGKITCATAGKSITEVALYDAATGGTGFMRATHDAFVLAVGDSIEYTIKTVFDQA
jgi:hypothetical protein